MRHRRHGQPPAAAHRHTKGPTMPGSTTVTMNALERDVLDHFKEGVGARTIALRTKLEVTDVQDIIRTLAGGDRSTAARLVAAYDGTSKPPATATNAPATPPPA